MSLADRPCLPIGKEQIRARTGGSREHGREHGNPNDALDLLTKHREVLSRSFVPVIEAALRHRGDITIRTRKVWNMPLLAAAVLIDRLDLVDRLLAEGVDPNAAGPYGWRALMNAQSPEAVRRLIAAGAVVEASMASGLKQPNRFQGRTALIHTAEQGRRSVVRELLAVGADPNTRDGFGQNALMRAVFAGHTEIVQDLIDGGTTIGLTEAAVLGDTAEVSALLTAGADLPPEWLNEALWWAAGSDNAAVLALLLDAGADIATSRFDDGYTPLHRAAAALRRDGVSLLLSRGADIRIRDERGATALHYSAMRGKDGPAHAMEILLQAGADVDIDALDAQNRTPLHYCVARGDAVGTRLVLAYGASIEPLPAAGVDSTSPLFRSPLMIAIDFRKTAMVEQLLEAGADATDALAWAQDREAHLSPLSHDPEFKQIFTLLTRYSVSLDAG